MRSCLPDPVICVWNPRVPTVRRKVETSLEAPRPDSMTCIPANYRETLSEDGGQGLAPRVELWLPHMHQGTYTFALTTRAKVE